MGKGLTSREGQRALGQGMRGMMKLFCTVVTDTQLDTSVNRHELYTKESEFYSI